MDFEGGRTKIEQQPTTIDAVQRELRRREEEIGLLFQKAKAAREELRVEDKKLYLEFAGNMVGLQEAWRERCAPLLRAAQVTEQEMKRAMAEHREVGNQSTVVAVPDGEFKIEASYPVRAGMKTHDLRISFRDKTFAHLLQEVRGQLVMEGLHNFGFVADPNVKVGEVAIRIVGAEGFVFETKCWLDQSGHLVV